MLSADDYDALMETVDVLSRPEEGQAMREGLEDFAAGRTSTLEEVKAAMTQLGACARE